MRLLRVADWSHLRSAPRFVIFCQAIHMAGFRLPPSWLHPLLLVSWGSGTIRNVSRLLLCQSKTFLPSHGYGSDGGVLIGCIRRVAYHDIPGKTGYTGATEIRVEKEGLDINVVVPRGFGSARCSRYTAFGVLLSQSHTTSSQYG
jgi:hypothetical protein